MDLRRTILSTFKLSGLILAPSTAAFLTETFKPLGVSESDAAIKRLVSALLNQNQGDAITKEDCENVLCEWKLENSTSEDFLFIINAFEVPRFEFCRVSRKFVPISNELSLSDALLPNNALLKSLIFANRYEVIHQILLRNELFSRPRAGDGCAESRHGTLQNIEFLLSTGAKQASIVVLLGMLVQLKNNHWHLEDPTNIVQLDLSNATFHQGLFPEGAAVLVEGWYEEEVFHVTGIGLPPAEPPEVSRRYFSVSNTFGGGPSHEMATSYNERMKRSLASQSGADCFLVLLGETRLDVPGCLEHLEVLFNGYADNPPVAFILTGDFVCPQSCLSTNTDTRSTLKRLLRRLLELFMRVFVLAAGPSVRKPKLVLVPGSNDPSVGPQGILPRPPLGEYFVEEALDSVRSVERSRTLPDWLRLVSNPVRLRLYSREVVIFRADYSRQLLRHCLHLPTEEQTVTMLNTLETNRLPHSASDSVEDVSTGDIAESNESCESASAELGRRLARCLVSQGHLVPLPAHICPVFWAWDQALGLHPLPSLVVAVEPEALADLNAASDPQLASLQGCRFANPGRFSPRDLTSHQPINDAYTFKVYYPRNELIEDCQLPA